MVDPDHHNSGLPPAAGYLRSVLVARHPGYSQTQAQEGHLFELHSVGSSSCDLCARSYMSSGIADQLSQARCRHILGGVAGTGDLGTVSTGSRGRGCLSRQEEESDNAELS